jgi:hypothetical protein
MKKLIGITGFARSGKDTVFKTAAEILSKEGQSSYRVAFADALKNELNKLLHENTGISAFTEDNVDKELIRPLLVTYGTHIRRHLNPNCWIEKVQPIVIHQLNQGDFVFVTDVRYENEAQWIKINGGTLINVVRQGIQPANHEEHKNSIKIKPHIDYHVKWPTIGEGNEKDYQDYVAPVMAHIIQSLPSFQQLI